MRVSIYINIIAFKSDFLHLKTKHMICPEFKKNVYYFI